LDSAEVVHQLAMRITNNGDAALFHPKLTLMKRTGIFGD
jgi:hypothetical protein